MFNKSKSDMDIRFLQDQKRSMTPPQHNASGSFDIDQLDPLLQKQLKPLLANLNINDAQFL